MCGINLWVDLINADISFLLCREVNMLFGEKPWGRFFSLSFVELEKSLVLSKNNSWDNSGSYTICVSFAKVVSLSQCEKNFFFKLH